MQCTLVKYTVRPECREDNAEKVRAVFRELERTATVDIGYLVLCSEPGEFVHIIFSTSGESKSLTALQAFREFQSNHSARCTGDISRQSYHLVGAYGVPRGTS